MSTRASETVRALDASRYRGLLVCAALLLISAVLCNAVAQLWIGRLSSPDKWYQLDRSLLDMVGGKSQIVELGYTPRPDPLIVAMGSSSMRLGLDSHKVEQLSGVPWLNIGVLGASLVTIRNHAFPFVRSGLKPDVVILGFHSCWLGRDPRFRENADSYRPDGWTWVARNKKPLADLFSRELLLARARWGLYRWPSELWQTRQKFFRTVTPSFLEWQLAQVTARGYFQPANYAGGNPDEVAALTQLLGELKKIGPRRVVLVDMPVHSAVRERTPEQAAKLVDQVIRIAAVPGLEFHDLRAALPDQGFIDYFHQSQQGELQLSEALVGLLKGSGGTPSSNPSR